MSENHGRIRWSELMTRDPEAATAYHTKVCGWAFEAMEMEDGQTYHIASTPDGMPAAGVMDMRPMEHLAQVPPHWFTYIAVDDVDAAVAETAAAGGRVQRAPWDVPGVGRIAILADPTGAVMGLMTPQANTGG
ncbi:MAG: VOC family protein [Pseudomonadota bacterium]